MFSMVPTPWLGYTTLSPIRNVIIRGPPQTTCTECCFTDCCNRQQMVRFATNAVKGDIIENRHLMAILGCILRSLPTPTPPPTPTRTPAPTPTPPSPPLT